MSTPEVSSEFSPCPETRGRGDDPDLRVGNGKAFVAGRKPALQAYNFVPYLGEMY